MHPTSLLCDTDDAPVPVNASGPFAGWPLAGAQSNDAANSVRVTAHAGRSSAIPPRGAMPVVAAKAGFNPERLATTLPQVAAIPFSSERQYMATLHRDGGTGS